MHGTYNLKLSIFLFSLFSSVTPSTKLTYKLSNFSFISRLSSLPYVALFCKKVPEGEKLFGSARRRWENNIKMSLHAIVWDGLD